MAADGNAASLLRSHELGIRPAGHSDVRVRVSRKRNRPNVDQRSDGLHGANRLASNSLLECLVWGLSAAGDILGRLGEVAAPAAAPPWDASLVTDSDEDVVISHNWDELRRFMWDYVGIVRSTKRLQRASHRITLLQQEITEYYSNYSISNDLIELRNLAMVAQLIIESASLRHESRGLHYTLDYPTADPLQAHDTILTPPLR